MVYEFRTQRLVEFADTDMAGILHFSNYFRYMEVAEHEFFRSLGFSVHSGSLTGAFGWARRNASCSYEKPLHYEDLVDLHLLVREKRTKSIVYETRFSIAKDNGRIEVARGSMTAVCIEKIASGTIRAVTMPAEVNSAIEAAPSELFD